MTPPLVASKAIPLQQSWEEPPPKEITKSQFSSLSIAKPLLTFATVGFGCTPS